MYLLHTEAILKMYVRQSPCINIQSGMTKDRTYFIPLTFPIKGKKLSSFTIAFSYHKYVGHCQTEVLLLLFNSKKSLILCTVQHQKDRVKNDEASNKIVVMQYRWIK